MSDDRDRGANESGTDEPTGDDPATGGSRPPEEMSLDELRAEIEEIDRELVEMIARRTYVADTLAEVKADAGVPIVDETQEEVVMARAGENAERFEVDPNLVKAIFRLLIELNKVEQREKR